MKTLEYFYQNPPKNAKFIDRKVYFDDDKILLKGSMNSGKTTLLCEYLERFDNFLYINLEDFRLNSQSLENLGEFIKANDIKAVGFDGVKNGFILPCKCENIIISTTSNLLNFDDFTEVKLGGLDYEEFIAFYRKSYEARTLFSHFLARGNGAKSAFLQDFEITPFLQTKLRASLDSFGIGILSQIALQIHQNFNGHQIYKNLKNLGKISKDKLYENFSYLQENNFINFIPNFNEKSMFKRVYFSDFGLRNALSFDKDPKIIIANMVFCELLKLESEIYFTDEVDFYLPKESLGIIIIPFSAPEIIFLRFKKHLKFYKQLGINKVIIISNANEANTALEGIKCQILPFWQWAVTLS
ncbi:ATPase, AAA family [Campylobacter iguaniorum]|uniref:ATP-binding protein n=1 Tax=Campylobacter iguaniorum TaxID=1244531 RepID=UPI00073A42EA|nr:ATP-binding protein [Campylobacter iguaniorum]ALV23636.1 ATPase, AAA family [Campylobacter iguaniorum]